MIKVLRGLYAVFNYLVILGLLYVHFIAKEATYNDALNFYMFPLPVIIGIVFTLTIFLKTRRYNFIVLTFLTAIWLFRSYKLNLPSKVTDNDLQLVFWNASRTQGFNEALALNGSVPDVLVLAEAKPIVVAQLQQEYPNIFCHQVKSDLYIFSKAKIQIDKIITSKYNTTLAAFSVFDINFYVVDVTGSTDVPRQWEFEFLDRFIPVKNRMVVLGDFNVPFESTYLLKYKTNFKHAFNEKGNGFRETWFYNLPILSLDHIWVSKDLNVLKTQKIHTTKSDHVMLKTYINP